MSTRHGRVVGVLYLVTFATSIPAAFYFLTPVLTDPRYVLGSGSDTRVVIGCLLDLANAAACVGTAVAAYPVVRRHHESLALGFVASRLLEAAAITVGVMGLLSLLALRRDHAAGLEETQGLLETGRALVALRDMSFQLGPNLCAAANAMLLGTLLLRSGLVPRWIPAMGLVGGPLLLAAALAAMAGLVEQGSPWFLGALPVALWELCLGIYLTARGFRSISEPAPGPQTVLV